MTKAWQTPPKPIRLADGARLVHGQLIIKGASKMQRPLNSSARSLARDGKPKNTVDAIPVKPGMRSRIAPSHDYQHGAPLLQDEKEPPVKSHERPIPLHPAATPKQRAEIDKIANSASEILSDASRLGKPQRA